MIPSRSILGGIPRAEESRALSHDGPDRADLSEVVGQESAKRALEVALAGGHHLLMVGPPGAGKTMLAERVPGLLPPLADYEAEEVAAIYARRHEDPPADARRPFRRPSHRATAPALLGGGRGPTPGEASLAHQGVLFLDELPLFRREVLDGLRGPLERGQVTLHGAGRSRRFSARFVLIAAMNACPCGGQPCRCSASEVARYLCPLSGALLDRLDLIVEVPPVNLKEMRSIGAKEGSATVAERIARARETQHERCGRLNAHFGPAAVRIHCPLDSPGRLLLDRGFEKLGLSVREATSLVKIARTIADLVGRDAIRAADLAEAMQYKAAGRDALRPSWLGRPVPSRTFGAVRREAGEP